MERASFGTVPWIEEGMGSEISTNQVHPQKNSYCSSIGMSIFEELYGRRSRTALC